MGREMLPLRLNPQFVMNERGKRTRVLITIAEYKSILDRVQKVTDKLKKLKVQYGI